MKRNNRKHGSSCDNAGVYYESAFYRAPDNIQEHLQDGITDLRIRRLTRTGLESQTNTPTRQHPPYCARQVRHIQRPLAAGAAYTTRSSAHTLPRPPPSSLRYVSSPPDNTGDKRRYGRLTKTAF